MNGFGVTPTFAAVAGAPAPLTYAFVLGLVAAVNPCGFPLLPAFLALFAGDGTEGNALSRTARGLLAGACVSTGFVLVFGILGLLVESGVRLVVGWVPWAMIPLATAMTALGVLTTLGHEVRLRAPQVRVIGNRRVVRMVGFGVAYAVGSLTCALPVFLAGVAGSFTRLGFLSGASTFVAYALGMGLLLTSASLIVAHAGARALRSVRRLSRFVPRVAGAVLIIVGLYLLLYWVSDLVASSATPVPVEVVETVQSALSGWLASSYRGVGVVLGLVVVTAFVVAAISVRRSGDAVHSGGDPRVSNEREENPAGA